MARGSLGERNVELRELRLEVPRTKPEAVPHPKGPPPQHARRRRTRNVTVRLNPGRFRPTTQQVELREQQRERLRRTIKWARRVRTELQPWLEAHGERVHFRPSSSGIAMIGAGEGFATYRGQFEGRPAFIVDSRAMADIMGEDDAPAASIEVQVFANAAARDDYIEDLRQRCPAALGAPEWAQDRNDA